jgi:hypothetical protein
MEVGEMGEVFALQVFPNRREILLDLGGDSGPAPGIAELKIPLDNVPDMPL